MTEKVEMNIPIGGTSVRLSWHQSGWYDNKGNYHIGRDTPPDLLGKVREHYILFGPCWECGDWVVLFGGLDSADTADLEGFESFGRDIEGILTERVSSYYP